MANANDHYQIDDIANEILTRCIKQLAENNCQSEELQMAQTICHEQRNNPALADRIREYTTLADAVTDGKFSDTLSSWIATKQ